MLSTIVAVLIALVIAPMVFTVLTYVFIVGAVFLLSILAELAAKLDEKRRK